jgi:hypothetical protein
MLLLLPRDADRLRREPLVVAAQVKLKAKLESNS